MESIVVGVDDTPEAQDGLELGRQLCEQFGWQMHVISVHSDTIFYEGLDAMEASRELYFGRMRDVAGDALGGTFEFHRFSETSVPAGMARLTEKLGASALVIGSSHRGPMGRVLLGDVGSRVVQGSAVPTFVAPRGYAATGHDGILHVGVGFDASKESRTALDFSAGLVRLSGGSLNVIGVAPLFISPGRIGHTNRGFQASVNDQLQRDLDQAADIPGVEASTTLKVGEAADELVDASAGLDLLVLGSRGYGPIRRVLLGGTSLQVTRAAVCPIAIVPKRSEDETGDNPEREAEVFTPG